MDASEQVLGVSVGAHAVASSDFAEYHVVSGFDGSTGMHYQFMSLARVRALGC